MRFTTHPLSKIMVILKKRLISEHIVTFEVIDPDIFAGAYAGTIVEIEAKHYRHRSLRAWLELAEILGCRMLVPKASQYPYIRITYQKLDTQETFHQDARTDKSEKYGTHSKFFAIHKMEEPAFYHYYCQALDNVAIATRKHILNLGINRGDEFALIKEYVEPDVYDTMVLVGIDHSRTAIDYAEKRFKESNVILHAVDINYIDTLDIGTFDLIVSIGTLQSPSIAYKPFLMSLVQKYLNKNGAMILGFPNSRWIGGEMLYGAKAPHYVMSEMGLVCSDIMFAKKYLQQKKLRVTITGKQYLFLTATKYGSNTRVKE